LTCAGRRTYGARVNALQDAERLQRTALVVGATGEVGKQIVDQLLDDPSYQAVHTFARRALGKAHSKLYEHRVDFEAIPSWSEQLKGDVLFSALGTTLKGAGGKQAQYKVDYDYQYRVAEAAAKNGVKSFVLISSHGASPQSRIFYSRMKGELERDVSLLPFLAIRLLRPGLLDGKRQEHRPGEAFALRVLRKLPAWDSLARARPIKTEIVAKAALSCADDWTPGVNVVGPEQLFVLGA
jgi:uncharacterized protein YbjT (DUF2867 family)